MSTWKIDENERDQYPKTSTHAGMLNNARFMDLSVIDKIIVDEKGELLVIKFKDNKGLLCRNPELIRLDLLVVVEDYKNVR